MPDRQVRQYHGLTFDVAADTAERWADALLQAGALSVDASDANAGTPAETPLYGEPGAGDPTPWALNHLTVLFDATADPDRALSQAAAQLHEPVPTYSVSTIAGDDWVRRTQAQFAPIQVTDRLWVVPSWCAPVDAAAINITLDPGLAFGTGTHPSTLLCLRWLAENLRRGAAVLDYGCGSGILAIAAAKLGAARVTGVDIDPQAVAVSRANAAANLVAAEFASPDALAEMTVDVLLANILANPLEILAPLVAGRVTRGGYVVLSGILEAQVGAVVAAYEQWFNIEPWRTLDGWTALAGVRRAR